MNIFYIPWIIGRKKFIFRSFCDFLIYFFFFIKSESVLISLLISLIWCLSNYLIGTYHHKITKLKLKNPLNLQIFKSSVSLIVIIIFIRLLITFNFITFYFTSFLPNIILIFLVSNYLQVIYSIYFSKNSNLKTKWDFYGSVNIFENLLNWDQDNEKSNIKIINSFDLDYKNENYGYIIEDLKSLSKENQNFILSESIKGKPIFNLIEWSENYLSRIPSEILSAKDLIKIKFPSQVSTFQLRFKRIGDILLSIILLISFLPFLVISALLIYLEDKGPVFYKQRRSGLMNKSFFIIKLRTMYINAEKNGPQWSTTDDKRVTKIGKLLRKYRIDELPQIINVLKGEMSLIGPRPERPEIDKKLSQEIINYNLKYLAKPGLSGWAQVNYPYGASIDDARMKLSYDLYYLKHFSIFLDLLIFFKTIKLVFNAEGSLPKKI